MFERLIWFLFIGHDPRIVFFQQCHHFHAGLISWVIGLASHEDHVTAFFHQFENLLAHWEVDFSGWNVGIDFVARHEVFYEGQASKKLLVNIELRKRVPPALFLQYLSDVAVCHYVKCAVSNLMFIQQRQGTVLIAVHWLLLRAFYEKHNTCLFHGQLYPLQRICLNALRRYQLQELILLNKLENYFGTTNEFLVDKDLRKTRPITEEFEPFF